MRSLLATAALLASLALPAAAHATDFVFTPTGGSAISFTLTDGPNAINRYGFSYNHVQSTRNGIVALDSTAYFYDPIALIGIDDPVDFGFTNGSTGTHTEYLGAKLFTGKFNSPSFTAGTYPLINDNRSGATASLVITNSAPALSATPEPSSLILLGTGALGLAGAARRRFLRA